MQNSVRSAEFHTAKRSRERGEMSLAEIYEVINGSISILKELSIDVATDSRLWTVMAALEDANRLIDELVKQE